jgi:hypothetical protein
LTQSSAANTSQHQEHQMAQLSAVQDAKHATLHQLIDGMNALVFNVSDNGHGFYIECRYSGRKPGCSYLQGRGCGLPAYIGGFPHGRGFPQGDFPPTMGTVGSPMGASLGPPGGFQGGDTSGPPPYRPPPAMNGRYGPTRGYRMPPGPPGMPPGAQANVQSPYSNVGKCYSNWNACYSCSFDITNRQTSMLYPPHLHKATHHIRFNHQNSQQYINLGHPCFTHIRHRCSSQPICDG